MAIRRAKQKEQVIQKLSEQAPPGETFLACVHVETGPSPWLNAIFDEIPLVGLIVAFTRKFYFLTLTNTSVVVNSASRWTNRPGEIVVSWPRDQVPITDIKRGTVWSKMYLTFPGHASGTRLNIHRYWRNEFDQLIGSLPHLAAHIPPQQQGDFQQAAQPK
ncbi:hypothetical protein [Streptacidiphilus monticola]|uniref:Uncharacterized protein n=1 Tax=Streptacidiphilus monticola TaxID=2161674 RepID=A0ABW1G3P9_9ACTN